MKRGLFIMLSLIFFLLQSCENDLKNKANMKKPVEKDTINFTSKMVQDTIKN